jgi:hypothetical protein
MTMHRREFIELAAIATALSAAGLAARQNRSRA